MLPFSVRRRVIPFLALLVLSGCSALSALGDATETLDVYELRAPDTLPVASRTLPLQVTVELPTTSGALVTDRIMIKPDALQAQYLPGARWSEETPVMVQTLLLRSLEQTNGLSYVARRPLGAGGDIAILTEVTDFQAESPNEDAPVTVTLRMTSRLVRERDVSIRASRTFTATAQAASTDVGDVVAAFDRASDQLLQDFATWAVTSLGARLSAGG
ncbi:ABC-type transport auxiliary lipoprotein family protein [Thalassococcus sp. BH17M4-6]